MATHRIYLRAHVPVAYRVYVEADSLEAAHAKVLDDVHCNGWSSEYWMNCETVEVCHDDAEDMEVLPPVPGD